MMEEATTEPVVSFAGALQLLGGLLMGNAVVLLCVEQWVTTVESISIAESVDEVSLTIFLVWRKKQKPKNTNASTPTDNASASDPPSVGRRSKTIYFHSLHKTFIT